MSTATFANPIFAAGGRETRGLQARASIAPDLHPHLGADIADLVRTLKTLFDSYHPEQHYMRGPGPKWRAKHAHHAPATCRAD
jgi:hypothetical protein